MDRCALPGIMPQPAAIQINSPWDCLHREAGFQVFKELTVAPGDVNPHLYNLFAWTGEVELRALYGVFTDVTNVVAVTVCYWDVWDGAVATAITAAAGTNCSAATLNSMVTKNAAAATALVFLKSDQARFTEIGSTWQYYGAMLNGKNATTNYIRWGATGAVATNYKIKFVADWICRYPGSTFAAV